MLSEPVGRQTIFENLKAMRNNTELNNDHSDDGNDDWMYDEGDLEWLTMTTPECDDDQSDDELPVTIAARISEKLTDLLINDCPLLPQNAFLQCFEFAGYKMDGITQSPQMDHDEVSMIQIEPKNLRRHHDHIMECRLSTFMRFCVCEILNHSPYSICFAFMVYCMSIYSVNYLLSIEIGRDSFTAFRHEDFAASRP